jgi:hypothetical protein
MKNNKTEEIKRLQNMLNSFDRLYLINIIQLLHLNEINMRFYGAEYNNIERGECSIKTHIDQVQV